MASSDEEIVVRRQIVKIKPRTVPPKEKRVASVLSIIPSGAQQSLTQTAQSEAKIKTKKRANLYEDEDEDSFFTRKTFVQSKITKKKISDDILHDTDTSDSESIKFDEDLDPRNHRKIKGKKKKFDWTKSTKVISSKNDSDNECCLSSDVSDEIRELHGKPQDKNENQANLEEPVERELTPPPEINKLQLQNTMSSLHQTLNQYSEGLCGETNITDANSSFDLECESELRAIRQNLKPISVLPKKFPSTQPVGDKVEILVKTVLNPLIVVTEENRDHIADFEKPMKFIIMASDTFEQMINHYCRKKGIDKVDLVLTYQNVKVFPRGTPESLGISGEATMEAFHKDTYNFIRNQHDLKQKQKLEELEAALEGEEKLGEESKSNAEANVIGGTSLHLKLQSKDGSIEKLKVKKKSNVRAIINRYRILKNIPEYTNINLMFEGEYLNPDNLIENTDLQDGDMINVKVG